MRNFLKLKERSERAQGARKFRLHFNRVNMQRGLSTVWTIHFSDCCIPATEVTVDVPVTTVFRPKGRQPRAWFEGQGVLLHTGPTTFHIVTPYFASALRRSD